MLQEVFHFDDKGNNDQLSINNSLFAANQGIGYELARQLAQQGFTVYLGARNTERGNEAVYVSSLPITTT